MSNKEKQILAVYEYYDTDDYSTEMILQLVADTCKCDISDVIDALMKVQK